MKNTEIRMVEGTPRIAIDKVVPYANNARINEHVVPALARSIERFGFNEPIVLDSDNVIVCGHTRVKAAKKLGMREVPCVYVEGLTQEEIDAYRLADNKIAEQAMWDYEKLEKEISKIGDAIAMTDFGFGQDDVGGSIDKSDVCSPSVDADECSYIVVVKCEDEDDAHEKMDAIKRLGYKCFITGE